MRPLNLYRLSGNCPTSFNAVLFLMLIGPIITACDFKLPSPPPDLFYKFNVIRVGQGPSYLVSKDINLDGAMDIIAANTKESSISILYGNGDGTFFSPFKIRSLAEPSSLAIGDLNGDGNLDIALNSRGTNSFLTLLGKGNNKFKKLRRVATGKVPLFLIIDDFNNDGNPDVAVSLTFSKMEIYMGYGNGFFKKGKTIQMRSRSFSGVSGDFNRDVGHSGRAGPGRLQNARP